MPGISPKSEELAEDRDKWIMILSTEIITEEVCDDGVESVGRRRGEPWWSGFFYEVGFLFLYLFRNVWWKESLCGVFVVSYRVAVDFTAYYFFPQITCYFLYYAPFSFFFIVCVIIPCCFLSSYFHVFMSLPSHACFYLFFFLIIHIFFHNNNYVSFPKKFFSYYY